MTSTDRVGVYYDLYRQSGVVYYDLYRQIGWYIMTSTDSVRGIL